MKNIFKNKLFVITLVGLVVLVAGLLVFFYVSNNNPVVKLITINKTELPKFTNEALNLAGSGKVDEAVSNIDAAIKGSDSNEVKTQLYQTKASILYDSGNTTDAISAAQESLKADSNNTEAKSTLSSIYSTESKNLSNSDEVNQPIDSAIKAAEYSPAYDEGAYAWVAELYEKQGDKTSAIEYYKKTLDIFDKNHDDNSMPPLSARSYFVDKIISLGGQAS